MISAVRLANQTEIIQEIKGTTVESGAAFLEFSTFIFSAEWPTASDAVLKGPGELFELSFCV